jgi:hypothetical protein
VGRAETSKVRLQIHRGFWRLLQAVFGGILRTLFCRFEANGPPTLIFRVRPEKEFARLSMS